MNEAFWDDMMRFKNAYEEMLNNIGIKFNLNLAEVNIILYLSKESKDTATDIVKYTGYSKSNVSTAVRKLELSMYLKPICLDSNRRVIHLKLLEKSKPVVSYYQRQKKKLEQEIFKDFTKEELKSLFLLSDKVSNNILKRAD